MTLLELVIVLTLMGVTAALVAPVIRLRTAVETGADAVLTTARRTAIRRGEPLRLRTTASGAWALRAMGRDDVIDSGHVGGEAPVATAARGDGAVRGANIAPELAQALSQDRSHDFSQDLSQDLVIDALGGCVPVASRRGRDVVAPPFDPLSCRTLPPGDRPGAGR